MENKGKAIMDPDMVRREAEEAEKKQRIDENLNRWWASQQSPFFSPLVSEEFLQTHPSPYITGAGPSHPPRPPVLGPHVVGSTSQTFSTPDSPIYTPASPQPRPTVVTDWITEEDIENFWKKEMAPIPPSKGPWYRFEGGHIQFRFGMPWALIDKREREAAQGREEARARGEPVIETAPTLLPDEHILGMGDPLAQENREDEEEEENNDDDLMEESVEESIESEEENENPAHQDWSDTSTITEEPTQIPPCRRRYIPPQRRRGPRGHANRHR